MKSKIHYILLVALLAIVFGCKDDPDYEMIYSSTKHRLYILDSFLRLPSRGGNFYIDIDTHDTKTNWNISGAQDWIKLSSTSGNNTETVTLQVSPNLTTQERSATFEITSSDMPGSCEIEVHQEQIYLNGAGNGKSDDPFDCKAASHYFGDLGINEESDSEIYIIGYVNWIKQGYDEKSGCATFSISQKQWNSDYEILVSDAQYLGNQKYISNRRNILIGDLVVICGKVINRNGTYQTVENKSYMYALNGATDANDAAVVIDKIQPISYVLENGVYGNKYRIKGTLISNYTNGYYRLQEDANAISIDCTYGYDHYNQLQYNNITEGDTLIIEGELSSSYYPLKLINAQILDIQRAN